MFGSPRPQKQITPALSPRFGLRRRFRRNPARFRHLLYESLEDRRLLSISLSFPLPNRTADTVTINSVFDHSMPNGEYTADSVVVDYKGERGEFSGKYVTELIAGQRLYAFKNSDGSDFGVNGHYEDPYADYLFYDGHPGYDFKTTDQDPVRGRIDVLAAAPGTVSQVVNSSGLVRIDHGSGYGTNYYHLSQITVSAGTA